LKPSRSSGTRRRRFPVRSIGLGLTAAVMLLYLFGNPLLDVLELKT
jgi:hypothetical protein